MKQYMPERSGEGPSKRNLEPIEVGRGTKGPSLHGDHTLEDKRKFKDNEPNMVDLDDDMAMECRTAETLDYIEGGGDGKGDQVAERLAKFNAENSNFIHHNEVDELYPTHKD